MFGRKRRIYRQGDVLLVEEPAPPSQLEMAERVRGRLVLAEGELTGHAHVVDDVRASLAEVQHELFLLVDDGAPVALRHEEHDELRVAPGMYRVVQQRQLDSLEGYAPAPVYD